MTTHPPTEQNRRRLWQRMAARIIGLMGLVAVLLVVPARPAAADICADAPTPVAPKSGLPGMLTSAPKTIPDQAPNPFTDTSVPIGDVYGYNWSWSNYDLGCGNDFLRDPVAVTNTKSANIVLSLVGATLAGLASLEAMAKTSSLAWLTEVIGGIADKLRKPVLTLWLPLGMLGVGLIAAFRAKRSSYADTMRTLLVIAGAVTVAVFALVFPTKASSAVDRAVVGVANVTGSQFSASPSDAITRESAYRTWLTGNFGNPDSAAAKDLGPALFDATHYSWSDMKRMQTDPAAKKQIDKAKANEFTSVAHQLEQRDPAGYEVFTGRGERTGPAMFGVVVVAAMSLFVVMAMVMVLIARVMMQGLALAAPLAAVVGILPTHRSVLVRLWDLFTAALVSVAKFVIAGGVMTLVLGAIQSNDSLGAGAKLFWIVVATVVGIVLTRPVRSFKTVVPGLDPNRSYLKTALTGIASYLGAKRGIEDGLPEPTPKPQPDKPANDAPAPTVSADARESLPALPAPHWTTPEIAPATVHAVQVNPDRTAGEWDHGHAWPGVMDQPAPAELPAAPLRLEQITASAPRALPAAPTHPGAATNAGGQVESLRDADSGPRVAPDVETSGASSESTDAPTRRAPVVSGSEVVYPTAIIVGDDESPLYRRTKAEPGETYIPMSDPELIEDGSQHDMVTYHSQAGVSHAPA